MPSPSSPTRRLALSRRVIEERLGVSITAVTEQVVRSTTWISWPDAARIYARSDVWLTTIWRGPLPTGTGAATGWSVVVLKTCSAPAVTSRYSPSGEMTASEAPTARLMRWRTFRVRASTTTTVSVWVGLRTSERSPRGVAMRSEPVAVAMMVPCSLRSAASRTVTRFEPPVGNRKALSCADEIVSVRTRRRMHKGTLEDFNME